MIPSVKTARFLTPAAATLRRLRGDNQAVAILEFAFVMPFLIGILLAILQISLTFLAQESLETIAESAGRQLMTGQAQKANAGAGMTTANLQAAMCNRNAANGSVTVYASLINCSNIQVDFTTANTFSGAVTGAPTLTHNSAGAVTNTGSASGGSANRQYLQTGDIAAGGSTQIVVVRLVYEWSLQVLPFGLDLSNDNYTSTSGSITTQHNNRALYASSVLVTENYT